MCMNSELRKWIAIGAALGATMGAATDNMGQWVAIGVAFGAAVVFSRRCR